MSEAQGEVVDEILYQFGGFDSQKACCTPTSRSYKYDPASNVWTPIAPLPHLAGNGGAGTGVTHAGATTDGEDVFLAGGYISANGSTGQTFGTVEVYRYDTSANTYERLPDLPAARASGALEYLDGRLHFVSGTNLARTSEPTTHYVLDLAAGATSWTTAAPVPLGRNHPGSAVLGGKLYFVAGQTGHDGPSVAHQDVFVYDPAANTWASAAPIPAAVNHISSSTFVFQGRIIVAGGKPTHTTDTSAVWAYSPESNTWSSLTSLPTPRSSGVAGAFDDPLICFIYTGGSGAGAGGTRATPV